ncbi:MAG: hypothetical protein U0W40_00670 [Acidimicrobiia bacterium]
MLAIGAFLVLGTTMLVAPAVDSDGLVAGAVRAAPRPRGHGLVLHPRDRRARAARRHGPRGRRPHAVQLTVMVLVLAGFAAIVAAQLEPTWAPTPAAAPLAVHLRNGFYANAVFDRLVRGLRTTPPTAPATVPATPH